MATGFLAQAAECLVAGIGWHLHGGGRLRKYARSWNSTGTLIRSLLGGLLTRTFWRSVALSLVLLGTGVLAAQTAPADAALDELMHKSGLWEQLPDLEGSVQEGLAGALAKRGMAGSEVAEKVRAAVAAAYSGDRMRASVRRELASNLTSEEVGKVLAWLDSDLGARITALENRSGEPDQMALRKTEASKLLAETPPARVEQIRGLLRAFHWGESMASMLFHTSEGITRGLSVEDPAAGAKALGQLQATMESQRTAMAEMLEVESVPTFVFIYRNLTELELAGYQTFLESPVGRRFNAATLGAIDKAMAEAAESLGRMLADTKSAQSSGPGEEAPSEFRARELDGTLESAPQAGTPPRSLERGEVQEAWSGASCGKLQIARRAGLGDRHAHELGSLGS